MISIIGADFIAQCDLLIDMRRGKLIDNLTKLSSNCTISSIEAVQLSTYVSPSIEDVNSIVRFGATPAEHVFGTTMRLPSDIFVEGANSISENEFVKEWRRRVQSI